MSLLFYKASRSLVKSGDTIKETLTNKGVSNRMSSRERKKKRIGNSAMMTAVVIEEVVTSEDPHLLQEEVIEVVVQENSDLDHQVIVVETNVEMMITAHQEIGMVVEVAHQTMEVVETIIDVVTDK